MNQEVIFNNNNNTSNIQFQRNNLIFSQFHNNNLIESFRAKQSTTKEDKRSREDVKGRKETSTHISNGSRYSYNSLEKFESLYER